MLHLHVTILGGVFCCHSTLGLVHRSLQSTLIQVALMLQFGQRLLGLIPGLAGQPADELLQLLDDEIQGVFVLAGTFLGLLVISAEDTLNGFCKSLVAFVQTHDAVCGDFLHRGCS